MTELRSALQRVLLFTSLGLGVLMGVPTVRSAPDRLASGGDGKGGKKVVFVASPPGPVPHAHAYAAGCRLLAHALNESPSGVRAVVHAERWPGAAALSDSDAIVVYGHGGLGHPLLRHVEEVKPLFERGVGLVCIHDAIEVQGREAGQAFLAWMGGYYQNVWSIRSQWTAEFATLPKHPVTRGVRPFRLREEWAYHLRFPAEMTGVTPILSATPPAPAARPALPGHGKPKGLPRTPEPVAWAFERPGGGRGFGFSGGHFHESWRHDDFRKLVLNAILWAARVEVPAEGVPSATPPAKEGAPTEGESTSKQGAGS